MRVLLCAATEREIAPTLQLLSVKEFHTIDLLITGVGLLACSYALTKAIITNRPDFILQAGVAGAFLNDDALAQVVAIRGEWIGDLGVYENGRFRSPFDMQLLPADTPPWKNGQLVNDGVWLEKSGLPQVDAVSVNQISTDKETIAYYRETLGVQVESMEGAALHYIALLEKIPFLQLRSYSNFIGERDKHNWQLKEAIVQLNREVRTQLSKLEAI